MHPGSITALRPTIIVSSRASVSPASGAATDFTNPVTYTVTAEDGTRQTYTVTIVREATAHLPNAVWGGETPRPDDWITMAFKTRGRVFTANAIDNSKTNSWFTYDSAAKTGKIFGHTGAWAPGEFTYNDSNKELIFSNYGGHGNPRTFKHQRDSSYNVNSSFPYATGALPAGRLNTVWGGATPQDGGHGWVTITFQANDKVVFSFISDNTTNLWTVVANTDGATSGQYPHILSESNASWMGPFKIDPASNTLVFNAWMGGERTMQRYR